MRIIFLCVVLSLSFASLLQGQAESDRAYDLAAGLYDRGLHDRAARSFRSFLESWPEHRRAPRARFHLADALLRSDAAKESLIEFALYLKTNDMEFRRQAYYGQGDALSRISRYRESAESFQEAIGDGKDELGAAATHFAAEALGQAGDRKGARALHERLEKSENDIWRWQSLSALAFLDFEDQRYQQAEGTFQQLISATEGDLQADSRVMLVRCRVVLEQYARALELIDSIGQDPNPDRSRSLACLEGRARASLGQADAALKAFERAGVDHAGLELQQSILAAASKLHEQGLSAEGLGLLGLIPKDSPIATEALYWRGILADACGQGDEAIELLRAALKKADDSNRRYRLADALLRSGRFEEAQAEFERVVATGTVDPRVRDESRFGLGFCLDAQNDESRAIAVFKDLDHEGVDPLLRTEARFACAECFFETKNWKEAAMLYSELVAQPAEKFSRPAVYKLAFCLYELGELEGALKHFLALARSEPQDTLNRDCASMAGRIQKQLGRLKDSAQSFELASQLAGDSEFALQSALAAAAAKRASGDYKAALESYDALRSGLGANEPLAYFGLAASATESGDTELVLKAWEEFVSRFPDHQLADEGRIAWAWALKENDQREAALQPLSQPFKNKDLEPERLFLGGLVLESLERYDEAAAVYRASAKLSPKGPRAAPSLLAAGLLAKKQGLQELALQDFDVLISQYPHGEERKLALRERALIALASESPTDGRADLVALEECDEEGKLGRFATFRIAELDYQTQSYGEAIERYDRLIADRESPADMRECCYFKRAFAHDHLGNLKLALTDFQQLQDSRADFAVDAAFQAGDLAERLGDDAFALSSFERAWRLGGSTELGQAAGRRSLIVLGRLGRSQEVLRLAPERLDRAARDAWSMLALMTYADASFKEKQYRAAKPLYGIVADHAADADAARARFEVGRCLVAEGKSDEAIDAFLAVSIFHKDAHWSAEALLASAELLVKSNEAKKASTLLKDLLQDFGQEEAAARAKRLLTEIESQLEGEK